MNKLLEDSLERVKAAWLAADEWPAKPDQHDPHKNTNIPINPERRNLYVTGNMPNIKHSVARLRLDWEMAEEIDNVDREAVVNLMLLNMSNDLDDLIENGDVNATSDPLLKTFTGSKIRGIEPTEVDIFSTNTFIEYKKAKKTYEYTVFLLMYVGWE